MTTLDHQLDALGASDEERAVLGFIAAVGMPVEATTRLAKAWAQGRTILIVGEDPGAPPVRGLYSIHVNGGRTRWVRL